MRIAFAFALRTRSAKSTSLPYTCEVRPEFDFCKDPTLSSTIPGGAPYPRRSLYNAPRIRNLPLALSHRARADTRPTLSRRKLDLLMVLAFIPRGKTPSDERPHGKEIPMSSVRLLSNGAASSASMERASSTERLLRNDNPSGARSENPSSAWPSSLCEMDDSDMACKQQERKLDKWLSLHVLSPRTLR